MPTTNVYKSASGAWTLQKPADAVEERKCFIPNRFAIEAGKVSLNGARYHFEQGAGVDLVSDDGSDRVSLHVSNIKRY